MGKKSRTQRREAFIEIAGEMYDQLDPLVKDNPELQDELETKIKAALKAAKE